MLAHWIVSIALCCPATCAEVAGSVSAAQVDDDGFLVHEVDSPFQLGKTHIRVLLPEKMVPARRYRVIYVLPVEAGDEFRYGNGLVEIKTLGLHNKHDVIFVAPTFSQLPWYADHPTDPEIRQESHLLKVVVPFVDGRYPVSAAASGRLLLGFSKSGWGAWSLLLRHPNVFGRAAAWDAPLAMDQAGPFGSGEIFGTQENFEQYKIVDRLRAGAGDLRSGTRLILSGYGNFRADHQQIHALLEELKIPHEYRDGPPRKHDWHGGWVSEAVELLVGKPTGT
jgi:S-formylglutathione hydrolase FrmB